ncbi:MAG: hypothetical protein JO199_14655 [Candidatus Eremiobacteraeota bacterium]|nr:hypothetical protein [Candidatus Eremiobacteraeota bacterium]
MSVYAAELEAAERQERAAYEAMEAWLNRPLDAPGLSGAQLEGYARDLRASRERLRELLNAHGKNDDLRAALARNEERHRSVGLTVRDPVADLFREENA